VCVCVYEGQVWDLIWRVLTMRSSLICERRIARGGGGVRDSLRYYASERERGRQRGCGVRKLIELMIVLSQQL
jgi:hypothetical protein